MLVLSALITDWIGCLCVLLPKSNIILYIFFCTVNAVHSSFSYSVSRHFYPKRLTFRLYIFCPYACSLGIEPTTFALLTQCFTTEPQEQPYSYCISIIFQISNIKCTFYVYNHIRMWQIKLFWCWNSLELKWQRINYFKTSNLLLPQDELDLTEKHREAMFALPAEKKWQIYCSKKMVSNWH